MARDPKSSAGRGDKGRRRQLAVVTSAGGRQRFLRGMITHDLVQRGLDFDAAYAVARTIRDQLAEREEVETSEIRDLIAAALEKRYGGELPTEWLAPLKPAITIHVAKQGGRSPFSHGLLARSLHAAGLDFDRSYRLAAELEVELREEKVTMIKSSELALRIGNLLERLESPDAARRYRLLRQIHQLPRPIVLYLGGASGTGKSTLALELAPLLRIYRINSTDTIRQVMRIVFTPTILPALHSSSFEVAAGPGLRDVSGGPHDPEFVDSLTATFEEQATRVCVGVRAVVERAIAENMSIVVEGVHLHPGIVPFADLEGAAHQVPLVLATLDEEAHRSRFLARARTSLRRSERYLENFSSIRLIHDHILQQAEARDRPLIDTSEGDPPVTQTLRVVTSKLQQQLPKLGEASQASPSEPLLLLVIDGLADRPVRALGGRTPLEAAKTPNLDRLAREGRCGLADPVTPGAVADTAAGSLALFGQSPLSLKRGPVEALGAGMELEPGDIALRANLATLDDKGIVIDRRAGRIREGAAELAQALDRLPLPKGLDDNLDVLVRPATEHRLALVLRGAGLSSEIKGSDPGDGAAPGPPLVPEPLDPENPRAVYTANALGLFEQEARRVLAGHRVNRRRQKKGKRPANTLLTRGAGHIHALLPLEEAGVPLRLACVSGDRTVLGLAEWLGANIVTDPAMTANLDTDLGRKFAAAVKALESHDLVVVHVKGADIAAHDQRPDLKVAFLEKLDRHLGKLLESDHAPTRIAVASDHATLSESGQHAADPLPVLIWGSGVEADSVTAYDETSAGGGGLQRFPLQMLLGKLFRLS